MKALGRKTIKSKVAIETERYMSENYMELAYHAICGQAPVIMQQTEAVMLYVLSQHGYGEKRLKQIHDWYCQIMSLPANVMGKTPSMTDVMNLVHGKYDIDLDRVSPRFPTFEEYCKACEDKKR